jgi:hypothetical protein
VTRGGCAGAGVDSGRDPPSRLRLHVADLTLVGDLDSARRPGRRAVEPLQTELVDLRDTTGTRLDAVEAEAGSLRHDVVILSARADAIDDLTPRLLGWAVVGPGTAWAAVAPLRHEPLVSVVLATRNRSRLLERAIASVLAQTYPNWELVVVDDGSTDDTADTIASFDDARIRRLAGGGVGASAARNLGLAATTGEYVTFLDDDNLMAPGWLRAIAEHTGRFPECPALYGAQVREPEEANPGELELLFIAPFDQTRLRQANYIDLGALAVRRDHPELSFDESLRAFIDWELVMRLSTHAELHPVPALASFYQTSATGRITSTEQRDELLIELQQRFAEL